MLHGPQSTGWGGTAPLAGREVSGCPASALPLQIGRMEGWLDEEGYGVRRGVRRGGVV